MDINLLEKIVALAKRRGFIYPGSEIYGGLSGTWDYGPVGILLKKNIKDLWWKELVQQRDDIVGIDAAIFMNPLVWEASGHLEAFSDPLVECKKCHKRFRRDIFDEFCGAASGRVGSVAPKKEYFDALICVDRKPHGKDNLTEEKKFNLLVKAYLGVIEGSQQEIYLRGEITQGVMTNFKNVVDSTRIKIPFGIAQIGKAFRNEITPGNFTFRSREFEQMELQYFVKPDKDSSLKTFEEWKNFWLNWYKNLGINPDKLRFKDHTPSEKAHYAEVACDLEYQAPWGWAELMGVHHRSDWDLGRHKQFSGTDLSYVDNITSEKYIPWDIESSMGVDRSLLFFLIDAFSETEKGVVLKLHPKLAPFKLAVFPLLANKPDLIEKARKIYLDLKNDFMVAWDERGNIGKRYAAQDEIGTPFCITIDYQSLEDDSVTVRNRDTALQERIKVLELKQYIEGNLYGTRT